MLIRTKTLEIKKRNIKRVFSELKELNEDIDRNTNLLITLIGIVRRY